MGGRTCAHVILAFIMNFAKVKIYFFLIRKQRLDLGSGDEDIISCTWSEVG